MNITKILFPINLDSKNVSHVARAVEMARLFSAEIHFIFVNHPLADYHHPADREDAVALKVMEIVPKKELESLKVVYAISKGNLDTEIRAYCEKNHIDLIILGHKHHGKVFSALFDSPDENIIDAINVPVLIIPKK